MKKIITIIAVMMVILTAGEVQAPAMEKIAGMQVVASQVAPDGEKQVTLENGIDLTLDANDEIINIDMGLNPEGDVTLEKELEKLPEEVKLEMMKNNVEIYIQEDLINSWEEGYYTYGVYFWDTNAIILDAEKESIEIAFIHEVGHFLDDMHDISYDDRVRESFVEKEISYTNPHFESSVEEYVAECINHFYNGTLDETTKIYKALDSILFN
ncbi:MAG: hypothetical protein ACRCX2_20055 [Paraclostridium sp.]